MKYYLGPWRWNADDPCYEAPAGSIGAVDFGLIAEMASVNTSGRQGCLCWVDDSRSLGSEYALLGSGDVREITRSQRLVDAMSANIPGKAKPQGATLADMILDLLLDSADPIGLSAPNLMHPGTDGWCDLWMQGHGRVKGQRFEWGRTPVTLKLKQSLRSQFQRNFDDAHARIFRDSQQHLKILDMWCEKYHVDDWAEFVPPGLLAHVPGRVPHSTTISDNFNRSDDATGLGTSSGGWSWSNTRFEWNIVSNLAQGQDDGSEVRAESDLSSSDHYSQGDWDYGGNIAYGSPSVRFDGSARTFYTGGARNSGTSTYRLRKLVSGTATNITTVNTTAVTNGTLKTTINGSSLELARNGSSVAGPSTDTAITSGTRTGLYSTGAGFTVTIDNFEAADLAASSILYTQLERTPRGILSGAYVKGG